MAYLTPPNKPCIRAGGVPKDEQKCGYYFQPDECSIFGCGFHKRRHADAIDTLSEGVMLKTPRDAEQGKLASRCLGVQLQMASQI